MSWQVIRLTTEQKEIPPALKEDTKRAFLFRCILDCTNDLQVINFHKRGEPDFIHYNHRNEHCIECVREVEGFNANGIDQEVIDKVSDLVKEMFLLQDAQEVVSMCKKIKRAFSPLFDIPEFAWCHGIEMDGDTHFSNDEASIPLVEALT